MKGTRGQRLSGEFQKEISSIISAKLRNKYPEMSAIISVTEVDVAPDLKSANVYVSIFDTVKEKSAETFGIIKENAGFIRHELSKVMRVRTVPELRFISDTSMEYGAKIDTILNSLETDKYDK
ncbi:MAG: 30S ribosome-binding factor RbfA [Clostridia bacterium]|nr:30S ribosome-binding factor RbfA [Clostridia bacterium]